MFKKVYFFVFFISLFISSHSYAQNCGFKPSPQFGCKIGRCVNGKWEQICGESNAESDSEAINSMIANPKTADIAGALDARQRRLEAEAARKRQATISKRTSATPSQLLEYEELRKADKASATAIMAGIGQGFLTANGMLQAKNMDLLYCQPENLVLDVENYMQIYDSMLERHGPKIENLKSATVAQVLIFGLIETFPCDRAQ